MNVTDDCALIGGTQGIFLPRRGLTQFRLRPTKPDAASRFLSNSAKFSNSCPYLLLVTGSRGFAASPRMVGCTERDCLDGHSAAEWNLTSVIVHFSSSRFLARHAGAA
jgi:hypothetical protein